MFELRIRVRFRFRVRVRVRVRVRCTSFAFSFVSAASFSAGKDSILSCRDTSSHLVIDRAKPVPPPLVDSREPVRVRVRLSKDSDPSCARHSFSVDDKPDIKDPGEGKV